MISAILPDGVSMSKEAKDMMADFCLEFVHLLSSESNAVSEKDKKKMILVHHVFGALQSLGFEDFVSAVSEEAELFQKSSKETARKPFRLENSGLSAEELLKSQEELFAKAREKMNSTQSTQAMSVSSALPPLSATSALTMQSIPSVPIVAQKKIDDQDSLFDSD